MPRPRRSRQAGPCDATAGTLPVCKSQVRDPPAQRPPANTPLHRPASPACDNQAALPGGASFPSSMNYDLIVIGGGPAGYVGAIRATQLGKKVACVENDRAGGTCLNWGCIPTKSLLRNAELYHLMKHRAAEFGFEFAELKYDWSKVIKRSRDVSDKNAGGIEYLFKKYKVDYIRGEASMDKPGSVSVKG